MPTFTAKIRNNQIIVTSAVSVAEQPDSPKREYQSILDTGAQVTMISSRVVRDLGLSHLGERIIMTVSGEVTIAKRHLVRLDIPVQNVRTMPDGKVHRETYFRGEILEVLLLPFQPEDHDVLLGMDFLAAFHMTVAAGQVIMSG